MDKFWKKFRILCSFLVIGLVVTGARMAWADESDKPIRLLPIDSIDKNIDVDDEKIKLIPPDSGVELDSNIVEFTDKNLENNSNFVEVGALDNIKPDDVGILAEDLGGFPNSLWVDTDFNRLKSLLSRIPVDAQSPTMRSFMLRLLLSPGIAPQGASEVEGNFLRLRAHILSGMGELDVAIALLEAASSVNFEREIAIYNSDRMLLNFNFKGACEQVRTRIMESSDSYWKKVLIFCQGMAGEVEASNLGIDLLRESGFSPEPAFVTLINNINRFSDTELSSMSDPSPLLVAMSQYLGIPIPKDALENANPALLRLIASSTSSTIEIRLLAAEKAEALGALPANSVGDLYSQVQFTPDELENPVAQSSRMSGPLARAILFQAISEETIPKVQAEIIGFALERSQNEDKFPIVARVLLPFIDKFEAKPEFAWFAENASRAYFTANKLEQADKWFDLALAQRTNDKAAQESAVNLWPLISIAGYAPRPDSSMLDTWWKNQHDSSDSKVFRKGQLLLVLFSSLGIDITATQPNKLLRGPLITTSAVMSPALSFVMRDSSSSGRLGETVILALLGLGENGPQKTSLPILAEIIRSLRAVGLESEAQQIGMEAALAGGL